VTTENVTTAGFPATPTGDSDIDAMITLPNPCVAPIVFVLSGSEDKWFAVIGFESEGGTHHPSHRPTTTTNPSRDPFGMEDNPFGLPNDPFSMPGPFDMSSTVPRR
jgi:hypothetical protein